MRRLLWFFVLTSAGCFVSGNLDNIPNRPAVEVTRTSPGGPTPGRRTECPANPPTNSCPVNTRFSCEVDSNTGCEVCSCRGSSGQ